MACINRVAVSGNLVAPPEVNATQSGSYLAKFRIALNKRKSDGTDRAHFFNCVRFLGANPSAGSLQFWQGLVKGQHVTVSGSLSDDSYIKDGQRRYYVSIVVDELDTIGRPAVDARDYSSGQQLPLAAAPTSAPVQEVFDEDIPF